MKKYYDINKLHEYANKLLTFKLDIQLFAEDNENDESEVIKTIKEEFTKQIEELKTSYEKEVSELKKTHVEQIKALVSGRENNLNEETKKLQKQQEEPSFEKRLLNDTRKNFGLKEE